MDNKYTSLELSKKLMENIDNDENLKVSHMWCRMRGARWKFEEIIIYPHFYYEWIPAYDILHDICVKYADKFFEKERNVGYYDHFMIIIKLLQQNKKQEVELYIWEHCLFNPKNKEVENEK